jgi:hypothetical protein
VRFILDANGTDTTDPSLVDRVYPDGRRVPLSEPEPDDIAQARQVYVALRDADIDSMTTLAQLRPLLKTMRAVLIALARREMED